MKSRAKRGAAGHVTGRLTRPSRGARWVVCGVSVVAMAGAAMLVQSCGGSARSGASNDKLYETDRSVAQANERLEAERAGAVGAGVVYPSVSPEAVEGSSGISGGLETAREEGAARPPSIRGGDASSQTLHSMGNRVGSSKTLSESRGVSERAQYRTNSSLGLASTEPEDRPPTPRRIETTFGDRCEGELWIIERRPVASQPVDDDAPGCGGLVTYAPGTTDRVPVPLAHTDVAASISAYISSVRVTQTFSNPFASKIEAVYVFPLPENSAVSDFIMKVGDRTIRGIIRDREDAQRIYTQARSQGYVASLMTQERPNIFTQRVANIEPGKAIDVDITYYSTLTYSDGGYEFVFPMVVGPRFNPPGTRDGVGATGRGAPGASGQGTEVSYLRPRERSGADISLAVDIDAGVAIEEIESATHKITTERPSRSQARVKLSKHDSIPNRDFVLRYQVAGDVTKTALLTHDDSRGGFFTMMLVPPRSLANQSRQPVEMVFVVDCSGSMKGRPIEQAKLAIERGLSRLNSDDTFQIIDFAQSATSLGAAPLAANSRNLKEGRAYLKSLEANGGTYMVTGMRAALDFPHDPERLRVVAFMTDGFIGNEPEILRELDGRLENSRVFGFGVGKAPNRHLMDEMSKMGRGVVAYVGLDEDPAEAMDQFMSRATKAAMTDISIDWGNARVSDVQPRRIPDLMVGRPVIVTGRYEGTFDRTIRVSGRTGGTRRELSIRTDSSTPSQARAAIPQVWARSMIAELSRRNTMADGNDARSRGLIRQTALDYTLLSEFTAFVAVDSMTRTDGSYGTTVAAPVPVPEGVRYETTVGGGRN